MKIFLVLSLLSITGFSQVFGKRSDAINLDIKVGASMGVVDGTLLAGVGGGYQLHLYTNKFANIMSLNQDVYLLGVKQGSAEVLKYNVQLKSSIMFNMTRNFSVGYVNMIGGSEGRFMDHGYRLRYSKGVKYNEITNLEEVRLFLDVERYNGFSWVPHAFNVGFIIRPFAKPHY